MALNDMLQWSAIIMAIVCIAMQLKINDLLSARIKQVYEYIDLKVKDQ